MEEKIKYKKCPYCELNYIAINATCCKVCYRSSQSARQEANDLENRERIRRQRIIEQNNAMIEKDNRKNLLTVLKGFGFIGFLHTTNFDNFINIYRLKLLKSRKQLMDEGFVFEDNAEYSVLEKTFESVKSKVRFFYRPITPTNVSAYMWHNQKHPVLIVFDENIIFNKDVVFCDGCAGSSLTKITKKADGALNFQWSEIFSTGPFNTDDFILKNHRNAEFLINSPISLENAIKFYFKNYPDYVRACKLFGNDPKFEHNPKLFY